MFMEENVILYSNHCVKCNILKELLDKSGVRYTIEDNIDKLKNLGFTHMPMLGVNGKCLNYKDAHNYLSGGSV